LTADSAGHEPRLGAASEQGAGAETWQGGQASQEAMQAGQGFGNESAHRSSTPAWNDATQGRSTAEHPRGEQHGGGGGDSEVH